MKPLFYPAAVLLASLLLQPLSSAETLYITGSTAFRSAANAALYTLYGGNLMATDQGTTNSLAAGSLLFTNCTVGKTSVDISVFWAGAEAGIQTVACGTNNKALPFFDKGLISSNYKSFPAMDVAGGNYGASVVNSPNTRFSKGCIAFTDTWQRCSVFNGLAPDNLNYSHLSMFPIGVVPYTFAGSRDFPWSDITDAIISQAAIDGYVTGNLFSGSSSDAKIKIWLFGRNPDSGTRNTMLSVTKIGIGTVLRQFTPTVKNGIITSLELTPPGVINGVRVAVGDNGEFSGGRLCGYLTNVFSPDLAVPPDFSKGAGTNFAITYTGCTDASHNYAKGLVPLSYNGVQGRLYNTNSPITTLDQGYTNIITGRYPFWSYEHIGYDASVASPQTLALTESLITTVKSFASTSPFLAPNIALSDMKVQRQEDGGPMRLIETSADAAH